MSSSISPRPVIAVIGAGPAGLFGARQLAAEGCHVVVLNRDIKPGGLAEYGIYPSKYKMKDGLRKQFRQVLQTPGIDYFGNVTVGRIGDVTLNELFGAGVSAVLVTVGAQGTKWLGLPGEDTPYGVYHAKDIVYHYNKLPPYSLKDYYIGRRVALVGAGNVMLDIARWCIRQVKVDEVMAIVRRGPAEVKFDKKEMEYVASNLDVPALDAEIRRVSPIMRAIGQDPHAARQYILAGLPKALETVSNTRFVFDFLASPTRLIADTEGYVQRLEVEDTTLVQAGEDTKARSLGTRRMVEADTVIFCIGDKVDDNFGLPVQWNEFVKNPNPRFPVDEISYELFDPRVDKPIEGVFVAGWSREASDGLVGMARKDGERGARAVAQYVATLPPAGSPTPVLANIQTLLQRSGKPVITRADVRRLEASEQARAAHMRVEEFKYKSNEEMLAVIGMEMVTASAAAE